MSFGALCGVLSLWAIALRVLLIPVPPHDFWWHMAQGRVIAATGRVPILDSFSWTRAGAPFFDQSWLAQWLFFQIHALGGIALLIFVQAALVVFAYALTWKMMRERAGEADREKGARVASLILLGVTLVSFDNWLLRPQTFVIPLFVLWLWTLEGWRRGLVSVRRLALSQVALMILWANSHGSFPLALLLNGATLVGAALEARLQKRTLNLRALLMASVASAAAVTVNPRGLQVLGYVKMMLLDSSNRFSAEWLSPTPRNVGDALFFLYALVFFLILAHSRRRPSWIDSAWAAVFFWLAVTSGRYILWFALIAALPLASALSQASNTSSATPRSKLNTFIAALMWLGLVPVLPWIKPSLGLGPPVGSLLSEETPVRAAQVLEAMKPRRLWHNAPSGSYLIWAAPHARVWIDTRFELYPPQQWRDCARAQSGEASVLEAYGCDTALVDRQVEAPLGRALEARGWRQAFHDARFSIWKRPEQAQVPGGLTR